MKKIEYLGLDFGSSKTCLLGKIQGENKFAVFLDDAQKIFFPSVMSISKNGEEKYFNDAFDDYDAGDEVYTTLKECLLCSNLAGEDFKHCKRYLSEFFKRAFDSKNPEKYDFSELKAVYYGRPSFFNPISLTSYEDHLKEILSNIFNTQKDINSPQFCGLPEPVLAAQAYLETQTHPIQPGDTLLVIDCGGYTLDLALVVVGKDKKTIINANNHGSFNSDKGKAEDSKSKKRGNLNSNKDKDEASNNYSHALSLGKSITEDLYSLLFPQEPLHWDVGIDKAKCELFSEPFSKDKIIEGDLSTAVGSSGEDLRFELVYDASNIKNKKNLISFVGGEYNIAFENTCSIFFKHIEAFLKTIHWEYSSISHVLFVGGAAKMIPLREKITELLAENGWMKDKYLPLFIENGASATWTDSVGRTRKLSSDCAVALGACIAAEKGLTPDTLTKSPFNLSTAKELDELKKKYKTLERKNSELNKDNAILRAMHENLKAKFALEKQKNKNL